MSPPARPAGAAAPRADSLEARAAELDWLLFDVDGVLTDGRLLYGADGEQWKVFDVRDGLGLKLAQRAGLKVGLLSGRESRALEARAQEIGVDALVMNRPDKGAAFREFLDTHATDARRVAYLGDDLVDLPVPSSSCPPEPAGTCAPLVTHPSRRPRRISAGCWNAPAIDDVIAAVDRGCAIGRQEGH